MMALGIVGYVRKCPACGEMYLYVEKPVPGSSGKPRGVKCYSCGFESRKTFAKKPKLLKTA